MLKIKYDPQVLKYHPEFIKRDANENDAANEIKYFMSQRDNGNFQKENIML